MAAKRVSKWVVAMDDSSAGRKANMWADLTAVEKAAQKVAEWVEWKALLTAVVTVGR